MEAWSQDPAGDIVVVVLREPEDLRIFDHARHRRVVTMLVAPGLETFEKVLCNGAAGALRWDSPNAQTCAAVRAVSEGAAVIPPDVARALAVVAARGRGPAVLTDHERGWVEQAAAGATIPSIARAAGVRPRTMERRFAELRARVGASNQAALVARAAGWGLADQP